MKIKELIKQDAGFQYIIDNMEFMSSAGRRAMLNAPFRTNAAELQAEWDRLDRVIAAMQLPDNKRAYVDLRHCLMQLHDLQGTLASLANHTTLNEVELFEIKNLAQITSKATVAIAALRLGDVLPLPNIDDVFALLDPDHTGMANFYIYDTYDPSLTPLRRELKNLQEHGGDPARIGELTAQQNDIQQRVCTELSDKLHTRHADISTALEQMAYADFLLAKAELASTLSLVRPRLGDRVRLRGLVNPRLKKHNEEIGQRYQPVDIDVTSGVTLITGANMAGKTVLLKSIGTVQLMAQCGFFVPAQEAETMIFDAVATSIGDEQNEMNGLSSYASEIIKISDIVRRSRSERLLALIDEPARTTNPVEGKALVQSIITIMEQAHSVCLITTHYSQLGSRCRRLRVRGFVEDMANVPLSPLNINRFIDYSLTEDQSDNVPHEALRIASILGCDEQLIGIAQQNINQQ
ncbi:MAG: hypothetical protein IKC19_02420 [Bacteroidales bacterium]|nr:hypothetical protein [Bacteroidales bacterium]